MTDLPVSDDTNAQDSDAKNIDATNKDVQNASANDASANHTDDSTGDNNIDENNISDNNTDDNDAGHNDVTVQVDSTENEVAQPSFGTVLQQARQSKQLSLNEVSAELFILQRHLQALEEERFDALPQAAFARGFAINYAKFLGVDVVQVATSFDAAYPETLKLPLAAKNVLPLQSTGMGQRGGHSKIRFNPLLIVAVVALMLLVIFLFRMVSNASNKEPETFTPLAEDLTTLEQAQGAAVDTQASELDASGSALTTNAIGGTSLEVIVTDNADINIIDATGNNLMSGSQPRGDYKVLGVPPFKVNIDNINNVSLLINQQPVALNQYGTDNQASFELTP